MRNDINLDIVDTCSSIDTNNEAINIFLKDSQYSASISTIHIPPDSTINTILLNNIKNSADNIPFCGIGARRDKIITGDPNTKYIDFNCSKTDI